MRRNVRGGTDSEVLFHVVLSFVHDAGALDEPDPATETVLAALRSAVSLVDELTDGASAPRSALNLLLTNGRQMYALGRGKPMAYVDRRGLTEVRPDGPLSAEGAGAGLHYVMVVSGELRDLPPEYVRPDDGTIVAIDRDLGITTQTL
jgi:glutamine amidotransferase